MFRNKSVGGFIIIAALFLFLVSSNGNIPTHLAYADKCDLKGKDHDDNNPSSKEFKKIAYTGSMCDIAKCVDVEKCDNHTKVDWDKFKDSPAYKNASDKVKEEADEYAEKGNGAEGFVGYEILQIMEEVS